MMTRSQLQGTVFATLFMLLAMPADAALVSYQFSWQVSGITVSTGNVFTDISDIHIGDVYSGYFSYEDAPDVAPPPYYGMGNTASVSVNDFLLSGSGYEIFMSDGFRIQLSSGLPFSYPRSPYDGFFSLYVDLADSSGTRSFASLPGSLSLADFDIHTVSAIVQGGPDYPDSSFRLTGNLLSLQSGGLLTLQAVPLPAPFGLLAVGLLGLASVGTNRRDC
jgi:hypothetical protein